MTGEEVCTVPGCGLPEWLHGTPDGTRPTSSDHWYTGPDRKPERRHGYESDDYEENDEVEILVSKFPWLGPTW